MMCPRRAPAEEPAQRALRAPPREGVLWYKGALWYDVPQTPSIRGVIVARQARLGRAGLGVARQARRGKFGLGAAWQAGRGQVWLGRAG